VPVPELLILLAFVTLMTLALGLPLLLKPDSAIPDMIGFGIMSAAVLAFIWVLEAYWVILPILAVVALVVWLDRDRREGSTARAGNGATGGVSDRTELRFRLWRTFNRLTLILAGSALLLFVTASGMAAVTFIAGWMLAAMVASAAFRHSFYRSCRRDQSALAGKTMPVEAA
jgi:hypothetical protein